MSHLTISLFGTVQVLRDGQPVSGQAYAKVLGLLAYLAVESDRPHSRASLALLLWPDQTDERARHSLRQALSTLRRYLGDHVAADPVMRVTRDSVQLRAGSDWELDVGRLMALLDACDRHEHERMESCPACGQRLQEAVALYRGEFLEGFLVDDSTDFQDWSAIWRERTRQRVIDASFTLAAWYEGAGELGLAEVTLSKLLAIDPWNERAHRMMMDVLWRRGRRGDAIAQFERCRTVLDDELGVEPEQETLDLLQRITSQAAPAPAVSRPPIGARPLRLPRPAGRLVGRERALEELSDLLAHRDCRLLTLTGPGGCGKTRLAIELASQQASHFHDGVCFLTLTAVREPEGIVPAVAAELDLTLVGDVDAEQQLVDWLRDRAMLLVFDNAEHVIDGTPVVARLLAAAPAVTIVVTSRERMQLRGEWVYEVAGLGVPGSDAADSFEGYGSIELFGERLRQARPRQPLQHEERPVVIRVCRLVDGMPLAIELAAAWAHTLTLDQIEEQIRRNLDFLATPMRDVPDRHRSMRAVFNQTWQMLGPDEQAAYRRLSVFRDGFLLEAAEAVTDVSAARLADLAAKSLLSSQPGGRYRIHGLLRQFGAELIESDEAESRQVHDRHCQYFLERLAAREDALTGRDQRAALDEIEADIGNVRSAWIWAAREGKVGLINQAAHALWLFYVIRGWMREGATAFGTVLEVLGGDDAGIDTGSADAEATLARAKSLARYGGFRSGRGRYEEGVAQLTAAADLLRGLGATRELGLALNMRSAAHVMLGDYGLARDLLQESLTRYREDNDTWGIAMSLNDLGLVSHLLGEAGEAERYCTESRSMFRRLGDRRGNAFATYNLGMIAARDGHHERARRLYAESLALRQDSHDQWGIATSLTQIGNESRELGSVEEARALYLRALRAAWDSSIAPAALDAMLGLAVVALDQSDAGEAEAILGTIAAHPAAHGQLRERVAGLIRNHDLPIEPAPEPDRWAVQAVNDTARRLLRSAS